MSSLSKIRSERIKSIRICEGFADNQQGFAELFGMSKQNISGYEKGIEPKSIFYITLYQKFRYNPLYVMGVSENKYIIESSKSIKDLNDRITELENNMKKIEEESFKKAIKVLEENLLKGSLNKN